MGSFEGHILPGTFFIIFGLFWTFAMMSRYFKCLSNKKVNSSGDVVYECTATYHQSVEGYTKMIASIIGITAEWVTAMENGKFVYIGNAQHITMFMFFGLNGLIDILLFHGYPLPADSDYMSMTFACLIEALLFSFHLHGRTPLDVQVHTLLIIAIIASVISGVIEWKYRYSFLSSFLRSVCVLLQGTWFYHIGFVLYPPFPGSKPIDQNDHKEIMLITAMFCWHIAGIIAFIGFVGYCFYSNHKSVIYGPDKQRSNPYTNITYSDLDNDTAIELLSTKSISNFNNNCVKNNYSLDESGDELA